MMTLNDKDLLRQQVWIDGQWVDARSGKTIAVTNPADGSTLGSVPSVSGAEVQRGHRRGRQGPAGLAPSARPKSVRRCLPVGTI